MEERSQVWEHDSAPHFQQLSIHTLRCLRPRPVSRIGRWTERQGRTPENCKWQESACYCFSQVTVVPRFGSTADRDASFLGIVSVTGDSNSCRRVHTSEAPSNREEGRRDPEKAPRTGLESRVWPEAHTTRIFAVRSQQHSPFLCSRLGAGT